MFRKNYISLLLFIALFAVGSVTASAQKTIGGKVQIENDKGKKVDHQGAKVDCYRVDVTEGCGSVVSDEKGKFSFDDIPKGAVIVFAVSGPGLAPSVVSDIVLDETNVLLAFEGDGAEPTEDAVRDTALQYAKENGKLTDAQKASLEEVEKRIANKTAKDEKSKENNKLREQYFKEGQAAVKSKDWDTAIEKFGAGYDVDPTFLGSAPTFLNNKAVSIKQRAIDDFNEAVKSKDKPRIQKAQLSIVNEFATALELVNQSASMLKNSKKGEGMDASKTKASIELSESIAKDVFKAMSQINVNLASYLSSEADSARAVKIYKDSLILLPKNPDAIAGLGLALFSSSGFSNKQEEKQESLNYMAYYMKEAPKDHSMREAIKGLMDYLVGDEKMKPQAIDSK